MNRNPARAQEKRRGQINPSAVGALSILTLEIEVYFATSWCTLESRRKLSVGVREGPDGRQPLAYGGALGRV
jgi:hypothetical protein